VASEGFFYLKQKASAANEPVIFVAPQALPGNPGGTWSVNSDVDHVLFEDILSFALENLCIDETRVFAVGFSFGASMTYSLSRGQQDKLRAAVGIAPANYNMYLPPATQQPIAWMQTTGVLDATNPWVNMGSPTQGAKYIAIEHATNNGCPDPAGIPIWETGGHLCYDFEGCDAAYPTKVCTFNGGHVSAGGPASATGWIADETWNFLMQF
jgi:poly(3-hydroxybutyrate) depolymerase